jgi:hypothetical protein
MKQQDIDDGIKDGLTTAEQSELVQLRREKRRLEMENEILRRAAAYFAKDSLPNELPGDRVRAGCDGDDLAGWLGHGGPPRIDSDLSRQGGIMRTGKDLVARRRGVGESDRAVAVLMATDWTTVLVVVTTSATTLAAVALTHHLTGKANKDAALEARPATLAAQRDAAAYATLMASLRQVQRWMIQCYPLFSPPDYKPPDMPSGESRGAAIVAIAMHGSRAVQKAFSEITNTVGEFVRAVDTLRFRAADPESEPNDEEESPYVILHRMRKQMSVQLDQLAELVAAEVQGDFFQTSAVTQHDTNRCETVRTTETRKPC